jgi:hypothetical protein
VKRRTQSVKTALPKLLREFDSAVWEGRDEAERYGKWMEARELWKEDRDILSLPGDQDAHDAFPDGQFRIEDV